MSKLRIVGAAVLSLTLAVATPAFAGGPGGVGMHGGGGGMHVGGIGAGGGMHVGGIGAGGGMHVVGGRGAQASTGDGQVGSLSGGNFTWRDGRQFAHGGFNGDHDRHHGYGRGVGVAAGLAAGSALGYGYAPYAYFGYYDPNYYDDGYASNDPGDDGYFDSVVSSDADASYCAQHYSSYDPASGTYLGNDGLVHPCP
jgi:BA14K-like protein